MRPAAPSPSPSPAPWQPSSRLALAVLLGLPLVLFWPCLLAGKMLWGADIQTLELVFKTAAQRALARGEWPLWMPEILGGMPGIAASNLVFLHPFELAFCLLGLPPWMGFGLDSAAQVALSGLGMWLLIKRLGLSRGAGLLGALAFAMSGTQISLLYAGHINNIKAIAMIPWVFWGALAGWQERRWLGWALCGAALALQVLGLGLQIFAYTIIGLGFFVGWLALAPAFGNPSPISNGPSHDGKSGGWGVRAKWALLGLGVAAVFGFCLAAPQLLPSLQYKPYSWREGFSYEQFTSWSFHPKEALGWIVPGFYGWAEPTYHGDWAFCLTTEYFGLLPWALAVAGLWVTLTPRPPLRLGQGGTWGGRLGAFAGRPEGFFAGLAVFSFLAGIGKHFPLHYLFYHLPIYNGFRTWTRFLCLLTFSVSVLSAYGWDALFSELHGERARRAALAFAGLALLVALGALAASEASVLASSGPLVQKLGAGGPAQALQMARQSALKAGVLALLLLLAFAGWARLRSLGAALLLGAVVLHLVDAGEVAHRYLFFKAPTEIIDRPAWLGVLPDGQGPEPFRIADIPGLWQQNSGALYGYETVQGYHGVQMAAPMKLGQALATRQLDWISLMNGRYILAPQPLRLTPDFKPLAQGPAYIYFNPYAKGRAFVLSAADTVPEEDAAFKRLGQPGYDLLNRVTVDQPVALDAGPAQSSVRWLRPRGNHLELEAATDRRSLLVISQTWYPAWQASVDGVAVPLLKADGGALSALALAPGQHHVELRYSARLLEASGALALLGLLGLLGLWKREVKGGKA